MSDTPPIQSCSQTWTSSSFMKNHLWPTGHFAITGCLQRETQPNMVIFTHLEFKTCISALECLLLAELPWEHGLLSKRQLLWCHLHHLACQCESSTSRILWIIYHLPADIVDHDVIIGTHTKAQPKGVLALTSFLNNLQSLFSPKDHPRKRQAYCTSTDLYQLHCEEN